MLRMSSILCWMLVLLGVGSTCLAEIVDVVYTRTRGEVRGEIIEEGDSSIVIQWVDPVLGIAAPLTISRTDIITIERDVEVEVTPVDETPKGLPGTIPTDKAPPEDETDTRVNRVRERKGQSAERLYIVPMRGQVGTDIRPEVYEDIVEDIKVKKPDTIVIVIESHDEKDVDNYTIDIMDNTGMPDRADQSAVEIKDTIKLRRMFAEELGDFRQVCWVKNAYSSASLLALSWPDMYMTKDAELGRAWIVWALWAAPVLKDPDKYGKYLDAFFGDIEGLVSYGGWLHKDKIAFIEAMVIPEKVLSTSWVGREAKWFGDLGGLFPLDSTAEYDPRMVIKFTGQMAEEFMVADGLAESYDDLVALLNARSFEIVGDATSVVEDHRTSWRRLAEQAREAWKTFSRFQGSGERYQLGAAVKALKKYISIIKRDKAVMLRMKIERKSPTNLTQLEIMLKQIEKRLKGGGGGGGGGGGRPGGGGGL